MRKSRRISRFPARILLIGVLLAGLCACGPRGSAFSDYFESVECLEDPAAELSVEEALSRADWTACRLDPIDRGFSKAALWMRLRARAPGESRILSFEWKLLDRLQLYTLADGRVTHEERAGIQYPRSTWPLVHGDYPAFQITPRVDRVYLVRMESETVQRFRVGVHTPESFHEQFNRESILVALLMGMILTLVVISFGLWFLLRDPVYSLLPLGLVYLSLSQNAMFGNFYRVFVPEVPGVLGHLNLILFALFFFNTTWLFRLIARLNRHEPRWDRIFRVVQFLQLLVVPMVLLGLPRVFVVLAMFCSYMATGPTWIWILLRLIRRQGQTALVPFVIGWSLYSLGIVYYTAFFLGWAPVEFFEPVIGQSFLVIEIMLFAFGLYLRYQADLAEKQRAVDQLQRFNNPERYVTSKIANLDVDRLLASLNRLMEEERVYLQEDLTLETLAGRLGIKNYQLSELLNARLNVSFPQMLVNYRLREAERILVEDPEVNVLNVGLASGFNSKSSFNETFKKKHGITPTTYRKRAAG